MKVQDVKKAAQEASINWRTVERARNRLRVKTTKYGKPGDAEQSGCGACLRRQPTSPEGSQEPFTKVLVRAKDANSPRGLGRSGCLQPSRPDITDKPTRKEAHP